jgi:hypothetical protein
MKKKIILALTACLFAAGSIINMHLAQSDYNTDISLADISVMAQADGENGDETYRWVWAVTSEKCECFDGKWDCDVVECQYVLAPSWASGCTQGTKCM